MPSGYRVACHSDRKGPCGLNSSSSRPSKPKRAGSKGKQSRKKAADELQGEHSLQAPVSTRQLEYLVEDFGCVPMGNHCVGRYGWVGLPMDFGLQLNAKSAVVAAAEV